MISKISILIVWVVAVGSFASAQENITWKCEEDSRSSGGAYESVALQKKGSLHRLLFTYVPNPESAHLLPALENKVLVEDLHCRFYAGTSEVVQCVSTNFKRFISSEFVIDDSGAVSRQIKVALQSDLLSWPKEYANLKKDGIEEFKVLLNSKTSFCGFPSPL